MLLSGCFLWLLTKDGEGMEEQNSWELLGSVYHRQLQYFQLPLKQLTRHFVVVALKVQLIYGSHQNQLLLVSSRSGHRTSSFVMIKISIFKYDVTCTLNAPIICTRNIYYCSDYLRAQHVSASTSKSLWKRRRAKTSNAGATFVKSGGGFLPRHKFDKAHTAFLVMDSRDTFPRTWRRGGSIPYRQI